MTTNTFPSVLATSNSVAGNLAILSSAIVLGLAIGAVRIRSIRLGISAVLFSSLLFGQLGLTIDGQLLTFLREFALIIFMYALGLQVGPSFGSSLRSDGLRLNALAFCVILLGGGMTIAIAPFIPKGSAAGLFCGAFSTTPGLAAVQETARQAAGAGDSRSIALSGIAYSVTYPLGLLGPIIVMVFLRLIFRIRMDQEHLALETAELNHSRRVESLDIEATSPDYAGHALQALPIFRNSGIVLTRLLRDHVMSVPDAHTAVQIGDIYRVVGPSAAVQQLATLLGRKHNIDLSTATGDVQRMDILVTRTQVLHNTLGDLRFPQRAGVTIAEVTRAGVALPPTAALRLAFADQVVAVGPEAGLRLVESELGNSAQRLNRSQLIPMFLGIALGVLAGSIPVAIPGVNGSLQIGLAGGSLLVTIALSRIGSVGPVVWYMPAAAIQIMQDFGLSIFLACVGIEAGDHFIQNAMQNSGTMLLLWGAMISMIPVLIVACFARCVFRMNFITLSGWIAGAMGSSTALLFSQEMTSSNKPAVPYAAILPLAELMPIVCAQVLTIMTMHR